MLLSLFGSRRRLLMGMVAGGVPKGALTMSTVPARGPRIMVDMIYDVPAK